MKTQNMSQLPDAAVYRPTQYFRISGNFAVIHSESI